MFPTSNELSRLALSRSVVSTALDFMALTDLFNRCIHLASEVLLEAIIYMLGG